MSTAHFPDDLISCALDGSPSEWQHHVARGILVDPARGLESLRAFDHPELGYYRSVLSWMAGDDDAACRGLDRLADARARSLLALIRRSRIPVLAQIPWTDGGSFRLLEGIEQDRKFEVLTIGGPNGLRLRPYERVAAQVGNGSKFAFFVCAMIEWQHPPFDLVRLACPTIGYTSDFDAQLLSMAPWLRAFDHVMVCDQLVEWRDVRAIKGSSVHAFPMVFCAPPELPPLRDSVRDIDVFFSGTLLSSYQPDKAAIVHQLLRVPGLRVVMLDGHVSYDEYFRFLSRAKITQNFCRHPGAMLTRALESLSMGSIALVQEGSVHNIWGGPDTGVFTFADGKLGEAVTRILSDYQRHGSRCYAHAGDVRRMFAPEAVASRFFRYAAVLATGSQKFRDTTLDLQVPQRRHVFLVGPRPSLDHAVSLCKDNLAFAYPAHAPAERLNLKARERALLHCQALHEGRSPPGGTLGIEAAIADLRRAIEVDGEALVIRFNLVRLLMHLSGAEGISEALQLAEETVAADETRWRIAPSDDTYPWDFFGEWFDSRAYLDTASAALGGADRRTRLVQLIYAALHHYIAVQRHSVEHARRGVALNPEFPYYTLRLAQLLAQTGSTEDAVEAAGLLLRLTANSEIAGRAFDELESLAETHSAHRAALGPAADAMEAARAGMVGLHHDLGHLRSEYVRRTLLRQGGFGAVVHQSAGGPPPRVTILVCGQAARGCRTVLKALASQSAPRNSYEVVYVECYEYLPAEASLADTVISCAQNGFWAHRLEALARAFERARGEVVVVVEPGSAIDDWFVERLLASYWVSADARAVRSVTVAGWLDERPECRYVAFPAGPARVLGGFDVHTVFAGRNGTPLELAFRLQQFGLPVVIESGGVRRVGRLPAWWHLSPFSIDDTALSACARLFPQVLQEGRIDALIPWRQVHAADPADAPRTVETTHGFNILRYQAQYVGLRQSLGAIDFRDGLAALLTRYGPQHAVVSEDLETVRRGAAARFTAPPIAAHIPAQLGDGPRLVETIGHFNIVYVRGYYVGLRHSIGAVDFAPAHDVHELLRTLGSDNVVLGDSLDDARSRILVLGDH